MKKKILFSVLCLFLLCNLIGQVCTPEPGLSDPGFYIDGNLLIDEPFELNETNTDSSFYEAVLTLVTPDICEGGICYLGSRLDSVVGLPGDFALACNPLSCTFPPASSSCLAISGSPASAGAGTFSFTLYLTDIFDFFGTLTEFQCVAPFFLTIDTGSLPSCMDLSPPVDLTTSLDVTSGILDFSWSKVSGAYGYQIKGGLLGDFSGSSPALVGEENTSWAISASVINPGSVYNWHVRAACGSSPSLLITPFSEVDTFSLPMVRNETEKHLIDFSIFSSNNIHQFLQLSTSSSTQQILQWSVYDINGRRMLSGKFSAPRAKSSLINDLKDFDSGLYVLEVVGDNFRASEAFIKIDD